MKEGILDKALRAERPEIQQMILREQLQHILLQEMDRMNVFEHTCFVGGTALRILYDLKRFSEDLDFSSRQPIDKKIKYLIKLSQKVKELAR